MKDYICGNMSDVIYVLDHNTAVLNNRIRKSVRRTDRFIMLGLIFGIAAELCFLAQNNKINELEEKLDGMNEEIKGLRDGKGD